MNRVARRVILFLLLGAIVNVAGAWGSTFFDKTSESWAFKQTFVAGEPPCWSYQVISNSWRQRIRSAPTNDEALFASGILPIRGYIPQWSRITRLAVASAPLVIEDGRGWPCICLRNELVFQENDMDAGWVSAADGSFFIPEKWELRSGLRIRDGMRSEDIIALPLRPVWAGFATNATFYAAILWLPFAVTKIVRRRLRSHGSRCTRCGYDLRGSINNLCPECGASAATTS